jgi:hypothetical protein
MVIARPQGFTIEFDYILQWLLDHTPKIKFYYFCKNARLQTTGELIFPPSDIIPNFRVSIIVIFSMHNYTVFAS